VDSRLWIKGELTQDLKRAGAPATYPVDRFDEKGLHIAPAAIEAVSSDGSAVHTRTFRPASARQMAVVAPGDAGPITRASMSALVRVFTVLRDPPLRTDRHRAARGKHKRCASRSVA
jgi:hypothetical protein